jgi:hypothetical protein
MFKDEGFALQNSRMRIIVNNLSQEDWKCDELLGHFSRG